MSDATIPLNATECEDDPDCTASPGTVCRVNRILPSAVPGGPRPAPSSTGKRCQCTDDTAFDPKLPFGCNDGIHTAELICLKTSLIDINLWLTIFNILLALTASGSGGGTGPWTGCQGRAAPLSARRGTPNTSVFLAVLTWVNVCAHL